MKRTTIFAAGLAVLVALAACAWLAGDAGAQVSKTKSTKSKTKTGAAAASNALAEEEAKKGEWSRWRGPNGDGISLETGLLDSWPEEGPPLAWRIKGLGSGYASISISGGKIFTLGKKQGRTYLIARNVADGAPIWETAVGGGGNPNCTPTVDGDLVFGLTLGGDLFCCQAGDGSLVWSKNYEKDFGGKMMSGWGYSESPLVDGDRLICTPGGDQALMAALDKKTGNTIWTTQGRQADIGRKGGDGAGYASIMIGNAGGVKQYITLMGRGVVGVDAASGKVLWTYNGVANGTANIPTPIVAGDYVFCSSGYNTGTALLKLNGGRSGFNVQEVYFLSGNKMQNHHGGMIQKDGYVYCGTGHNEGFPLCIQGSSGTDAWRPGRGPGSGSAAIAYADGHFYFRYEDATMALIEANPKEFKLKGEFRIASRNDKSWPHPVIAGGKLYLRDQDELLVYDIKRK